MFCDGGWQKKGWRRGEEERRTGEREGWGGRGRGRERGREVKEESGEGRGGKEREGAEGARVIARKEWQSKHTF